MLTVYFERNGFATTQNLIIEIKLWRIKPWLDLSKFGKWRRMNLRFPYNQ